MEPNRKLFADRPLTIHSSLVVVRWWCVGGWVLLVHGGHPGGLMKLPKPRKQHVVSKKGFAALFTSLSAHKRAEMHGQSHI